MPPRDKISGSAPGAGGARRGEAARGREADIILRTLHGLVEPLAALLPGECEVVLHDLRLLPHSVVAVAGDLASHPVGGPPTGPLLRASAGGTYSTALGYRDRHADGREVRGSTLIVRDSAGTAVAALCIDNDTDSWQVVADLARSMMPWTRANLATGGSGDTVGADDTDDTGDTVDTTYAVGHVDALAQQVLASAIKAVGVPVDLMHKRHKLAVVRALKDRGFFRLKEGVETAAQALGVTRFSVYNYLNDIETTDAQDAARPAQGPDSGQ